MHQFQNCCLGLKGLFRGLFEVYGSGFEAESLKFRIWEFGGFGLWVKVRVGLWSWGGVFGLGFEFGQL